MKKYFSYYNSPLGTLEIVACDNGLREINFNPTNRQVETLNAVISNTINQLDEYFLGKRKIFDLPLILDGTEFQKKVWNELINIPYGSIATYKQIANSIQSPNASRAIGNANNKNKIPIIIPCHRVIGSNGKLVGYSGGLSVKQWLLNHEQRKAAKIGV